MYDIDLIFFIIKIRVFNMTSLTLSSQTELVSVVTYNCLAGEYLHYLKNLTPAQVAYTTQPQFEDQKVIDCVARIQKLDHDVICVQELSASVSAAFARQMNGCGYTVVYEQFDKKPDGVATCFRTSKFASAGKEVLSYQDTTGRKALFLHLKTTKGAVVDVCNTHLQGGSANQVVANLQIQTLVQKVNQAAVPVILCMDGNFTPADPKFQVMQQHFIDSLNGHNIPTSMNGQTPLRVDYIWHSNSLVPLLSHVEGDLSAFLTSQEPSDHIPVIATFSLPTPTTSPSPLTLRNKFPGSDASPSFRRQIFGAFNDSMLRLHIDQVSYDKYATSFEAMIDRANVEDQKNKGKGQFLPSLLKEIALNSTDWPQAQIFLDSCSSSSAASIPYYNVQPFNNIPSFRHKVFEQFNHSFSHAGIASPEIYQALASRFDLLLADANTRAQGGNFLSILEQLIQAEIPNGMAKDLYLGTLKAFASTPTLSSSQITMPKQPVLPTETVILVKYKDVPGKEKLFIRGSCAGLNWKKGVQLKRLDQETHELRIPHAFLGKLEFKVVVGDDGDDERKWEEGVNHVVEQGEKVEIQPIFPVLNKVVVEVYYPLSPGKTLCVSGTGPLGNWDKELPMKTTDNCTWQLILDGQFVAFKYKLRSDGRWEQGPDREAEYGKKSEIKAVQF
jgi:endonuclease/exonuclease/phosphatase family metal-dependent hydrolase